MLPLRHIASTILPVVILAAGPTPNGFAQKAPDDEPFRPGLVARFRDGAGTEVTRVDHQLAFHWGDAVPDPRLAPGQLRATWQGQLSVESAGDYRFLVFGAGEVELTVAGRVALARQVLRDGWCESPPLPLAGESVPVELSFRRTETDARLMVLWSGPQLGPEPIPPRLLSHARERTVGNDFERGQLLSRVLRCGRCHGDEPAPAAAPALDRLAGNVARPWLVRWLTAGEHAPPGKADTPSPRWMPALGLSDAQAEAIADYLLAAREPTSSPSPLVEEGRVGGNKGPTPAPPTPQPGPPPQGGRETNSRGQGRRARPAAAKPRPDAKIGEQLFLTLGCLACHSWRDLGAGGWLGGGDLTHVADKRPPAYFAAWLADPARLNPDHRMPVFSLSDDERTALALFLAEQKSDGPKPSTATRPAADRRAEGGELVKQFHCGACHRLPETAASGLAPAMTGSAPRLGEQSRWDRSCLGAADPAKHRPGYQLGEGDARAVRAYYVGRRPTPANSPPRPDGRLVLAEHNCLACHAREGTREATPLLPPPLADKLTAVAGRYPDLAPQIPALTPPALNSVGDKLTDQALSAAVARRDPPHRPYLQVRMPRFPLRDDELHALVKHLTDTDRIPERGPATTAPDRPTQDRYALAGGRLVSGDGFGCTSCHQVGHVLPSQAPLNARGPDLSQLGGRIRRTWFDRWVRNPARIVPRMEMPSVQIPVAGVLGEQLDDQLAAVWHVLNLPDFEPPPPNPIRTLRHHGHDPAAEPVVMTDVLRLGDTDLVKPFLVGLANRHNVLFDLETARLARWTVGDTARQRTEGKTWFWELAGAPVLDTQDTSPDLTLLNPRGVPTRFRPLGQFVTEADAWETHGPSLVLHYRLIAPLSTPVHVRRKLTPVAGGFVQEVTVRPGGNTVLLDLLPRQAAERATQAADGRAIHLNDRFVTRIVLPEATGAKFSSDNRSVHVTPDATGTAQVVLHYLSDVPVDRFPEPPPAPAAARKGEPVEVAPGFVGERLPLSAEIMPTGLAWRPDGRLVFCSLKGQVFEATDTDGEGGEDRLTLLADGLPAPYGVNTGPGYVDVSAKYALLRVWDAGPSARHVETIASGWGYTADYHDWAVGLPRNGRGEYFLGIPCEQDKRSPAAARFRGNVLRLVPREPTADDPRRFTPEPVSAGHRFPMGLAFDRRGELFVTDNQGNYNPFNELNHVRPGVHFGFINFLDRGKPTPPLTSPAINIPHPWTRSVNGICFLDTPPALRAKLGRDLFGPLEGHLVGCEYDTRRLIRMTLQRVGDTYQGAAYPLSIAPADPGHGFLGPVVCGVSPRGELYVGGLRDSGWGAGNNVGEIVRVRVEPDNLPCGIAEVRATADGFTIDFVRPIDQALAERVESYAVQSYRREATPAYGGPDRDRRTEAVTGVSVAADGRRVTLRLAELRPGFVYELRLANLAPGGGPFHPAEAHYTLRVVPK
jgi:mono/diheme cytochrome c family protein